MKTRTIFFSMTLGTLMASAAPVVSDVSVRQTTAGKVAVDYLLSGDAAVVTLSLQVRQADGSWQVLDDASYTSLAGDVNRVVKPSSVLKSIAWDVGTDRPQTKVGDIRAFVEAWPLDALPCFMAVDLAYTDTEVAYKCANAVKFYRSKAALPGGIGDRRYKTEKLLMRKIPAKGVVWTMGDGGACVEKGSTATKHKVTLMQDYYMGVYEFTLGQYSNYLSSASMTCGNDVVTALPTGKSGQAGTLDGMFTRNSAYTDGDYDLCPIGAISVDIIRGDTQSGAYALNGATVSHAVESGRFLDCLRRSAGHSLMFDLPTEAQWEYACRAGTWTKYCWGDSAPEGCSNAWFKDNTETGGKKHPVGLKEVNVWDMYDMHGNVKEMCLDPWVSVIGALAVTDPFGGSSADSSKRTVKGSCYADDRYPAKGDYYGRTSSRYRLGAGYSTANYAYIGFRLVCPAVVTVP